MLENESHKDEVNACQKCIFRPVGSRENNLVCPKFPPLFRSLQTRNASET